MNFVCATDQIFVIPHECSRWRIIIHHFTFSRLLRWARSRRDFFGKNIIPATTVLFVWSKRWPRRVLHFYFFFFLRRLIRQLKFHHVVVVTPKTGAYCVFFFSVPDRVQLMAHTKFHNSAQKIIVNRCGIVSSTTSQSYSIIVLSRLYYESVANSKICFFNGRTLAMNSPIRIPTTDSVGTARRPDYICFRFLRPATVLKQKRVASRASLRRKMEDNNWSARIQ